MKKNSGEVIIGALIGLAVGAVMLWINAGNYAQTQANSTGMEVSSAQYLSDEPGISLMTVIGPSAAGAGIGWALEEFSSSNSDGSSESESGRDSTTISVDGDGNTVQVRGDEFTTGSGEAAEGVTPAPEF
jgi:hypothetical protein